MNQEILPPRYLIFSQPPGTDFDDRRSRGLPVTETFDQTKVKNDVVKRFFGNLTPAFRNRLEDDLWSERNARRDGEVETGDEA